MGEIYSKGKIHVNALALENKAVVSGNVNKTYVDRSNTHYAWYGVRYDEIKVEGSFSELTPDANIKVKNIGRITSEDGLEFTSKDKANSSILNNGIINVKGDLKYDAKCLLITWKVFMLTFIRKYLQINVK
ncbi:Uncharacterised protein [Actinobacillus equuli]|nr:Uncharacterised protein [Actinobacillus equuli]